MLLSPGQKLQVLLAGAITTAQLPIVASYAETADDASTLAPGSGTFATNNTTAVDVVAAPAAAKRRSLRFLNVYNADSVAATVIVRVDDGGTSRIVARVTLPTEARLEYTPDLGFHATANGTALTGVVVDSIADGDTANAPSRNAVFDALALKQALLSLAANEFYARASAGAAANKAISDDALTMVAAANFAAIRAALSLGSAALLGADTDGTLAANSDALVPTQKAVKTAIAAAVTGLWEVIGGTDCSTNPNYPAANKGDAYVVTVAGKIGGASGTSVDVGDVYVALLDNAGGTEAAVGTSWLHLEHNLVGALLTSQLDTDGTLAANSDAKIASQKATKTYADTKEALLSLAANTFRARSSAGAAANKTITDLALSLLDDAAISDMQTTLGLAIDVQTFAVSGTWTKPANARSVRVVVIGAGGGGGSGRKGAAATIRCGGGAGASGGRSQLFFRAADLTATVAVTIGAGGVGGAAQSSSNSNGNAGTAGGDSIFGTYLSAIGGGFGRAGTATNGLGANMTGTGLFSDGMTSPPASTSGGAGGSATQPDYASGAGSSGGGITAADVASTSVPGKSTCVFNGTSTYATASTAAGSDGASGGNGNPNNDLFLGSGGAGGAGSILTNGGNGGNGGGYGAGGGGSGAALNAVGNSGTAGNGSDGYCIVFSY